MNIVDLDADLPDIRSLVRFKGHEQACLVIRADKAKSDAKVFREAASLLAGSDRGNVLAAWLNDLAAKYDRLENPVEEAA